MTTTPRAFRSNKEFKIALLFLLSIVIFRLFNTYQDYKNLQPKTYYYTDAQVIKQFTTNNQKIFKLQTENGVKIYMRSDSNISIYRWVRVRFYFKKRYSFFTYLKGFYATGKILKIYNKSYNAKEILEDKIGYMHKNKDVSDLYKAIFLATDINSQLRVKVANLGLSHLIAISGFHLGILSLMIYAILYLPYSFFQKRHFPYRDRIIDLGFISLIIIFIFVIFINAPPSVIRAFGMLVIMWITLLFGLSIISFRLLAITLLILISIFPKLVISYGFILSFSGVFYIFLLLKYYKESNKWLLNFIIVPLGIYILMLPIAHMFFDNFTLYSLLSPVISLLFIPFYPISILAHIIGYPQIFDNQIEWLLQLKSNQSSLYTPKIVAILYIVVSIKAIKSVRFFNILKLLAISILIWFIISNSFV